MSKHDMDSLIVVGVVRKPHGIRGELTLGLTVDDPGLLSGTVFLQPPAKAFAAGKGETTKSFPHDARPYTVSHVRMHHGAALLLLKEVTDRNAAESLRGFRLSISRTRLPKLAEDEMFLSDLLGLRVSARLPAASAEGGAPLGPGKEACRERELGVITSVDEPSGQILWTITTSDGKEILFPAVEAFVLRIDQEEGLALIDPPPGLLELYLGD